MHRSTHYLLVGGVHNPLRVACRTADKTCCADFDTCSRMVKTKIQSRMALPEQAKHKACVPSQMGSKLGKWPASCTCN